MCNSGSVEVLTKPLIILYSRLLINIMHIVCICNEVASHSLYDDVLSASGVLMLFTILEAVVPFIKGMFGVFVCVFFFFFFYRYQ